MTRTDTDHGWPLAHPVAVEPPAARPREGAETNPSTLPSRGDALDRLGETLHPPRAPATVLDRGLILDATAACLDEYGYDGTTIRRIARRLDCAIGSIYRYFDDKRELLTAVCERRFEAALEPLERRAATNGRAAVDASARRYAALAEERPEAYRLMFWLAAVGRDRPGRAIPGVVDRMLDAWAERLGDRVAARDAWCGLHGRLMLGEAVDAPISAASARPAPMPPPPPSAAAAEPGDDLTLL